MNPFFFNIAYKYAKRRLNKKNLPNLKNTHRKAQEISISFLFNTKNFFLIVIGVFSAGFGLKGFLLPNEFIDGGVTGISLLISLKTMLPLAVLIVIINIPFFIFGIKQNGKWFIFKSILAILLLAIVIFFVEYPIITHDKLLVAVFGGFFLGTGIGLSIRGGAVIDGTEILAIYLSKKIGFTVGDLIAFFNIIIFSVAAYLLTLEQALYSILTYLAASKAADFVIEGVDEYTSVTIISELSDEIRLMIINTLKRGVTVINGHRGYTREGEKPQPIDMLYTVITRLEIARLKKEVEKIDPKAFLIMSSVNDTKGGMLKKRKI